MTEPSFLPTVSSNAMPAHKPGANSAGPQNRKIPVYNKILKYIFLKKLLIIFTKNHELCIMPLDMLN